MPHDAEGPARALARLRERMESVRANVEAVAAMPGSAGEHARSILAESVRLANEREERHARELARAVATITGYDPASASGDVRTMVTVEQDGNGTMRIVDIQQEGAVPRREGVEYEEDRPVEMETGAIEGADEQQELTLDREQYRPRLSQVSLDAITLEGPVLEPTPAFVENVRRLGITQPVALVRTNVPDVGEQGTFKIAAGRRRVRAAGLAAMSQIPALVFPFGTPLRVAAAIALSENTHRAPNPITDLEAIEALVREGHSHEQIAHTLRIPLNVLDARMVLANLSPAMRTAVANGRIAVGVAQRIARLDPERRRQAESMLESLGRVTGADVRTLMQARTDEATALLPDSMFAPTNPAHQSELGRLMQRAGEGALRAVPGSMIELYAGTPENPGPLLGTIAATPDFQPGSREVMEVGNGPNARLYREDETSIRTERQVAAASFTALEPSIEVDEQQWVLRVRNTDDTMRREAIVRGRLEVDPNSPVRIDVGGQRYVPETREALEYQGEVRVRARDDGEQFEAARMVARWANGQQTTVKLRRSTLTERLPDVEVGGERWVRRNAPQGPTDSALIATPDGQAIVRCEQDENGLALWTIGGREFISREAAETSVEADQRMVMRAEVPLADVEEGWEGVLTALERAEAALPAAPDEHSERAFGLVMEAVDLARTMVRAEGTVPARSVMAAAVAADERLSAADARRAVRAQDAVIQPPPVMRRPPRRRA